MYMNANCLKNETRHYDRNRMNVIYSNYAKKAVEIANSKFQVSLDFSEESVLKVESILTKLNELLKRTNPPEDILMTYVKMYAAYVGNIIISNWGGYWEDKKDDSKEIGPILKVKEFELYLVSKIYRRVKEGSMDNIWEFYNTLKYQIEHSNNCESLFKRAEMITQSQLASQPKKGWLSKLFKN